MGPYYQSVGRANRLSGPLQHSDLTSADML